MTTQSAQPVTTNPTLTDQVTRMYDMIGGYHATHLLEIARELGVWEAITASPGITSKELASTLKTDKYYTDVLCRTAFSLALLDRDGAGWRMAPHLDRILGDSESSFYLADFARVHMMVGEDYSDYPLLFRSGGVRPYQEHGEAFMAAVASATKALPTIVLDLALPSLPLVKERLEAGCNVLDVGCGAGWALVQFARRFAGVTCTGVDVEPHSVKLAQRLIASEDLEDRCQARLAGAEDLAEAGAYDIAMSFLVIHEIEPQKKPAAFEAVARALKPGGYFLIFDEAYPETDTALRTMPARFAALAQWYELTWGNRVNTRTELHALCRSAGLEVVEETAFSRFHILVAKKP
jgi:SAM-dependent methyltransferase